MSTRVRVTFEEYEDMVRRGEFEPRECHHVELVQGEIRAMSPIGALHSRLVRLLNLWTHRSLRDDQARIYCQSPIGIPALESEPEPDLFWCRIDAPEDCHTRPEDVLLLIEVADSSLAFDRGEKAELYASAGIADYWIVNIPDSCAEVRRRPEGGAYREIQVYRPGQEVRPMAFPELAHPVSRLIPREA